MNPFATEEIRRRAPAWAQLIDLVEAARKRGYSQEQVDYLASVVGVAWAKGYNAGAAERER